MHKRFPLFVLFLALSSVAGLKSVAASPDCDKWLKQYQDELANAAAVKKVVHHVHHLVHRPQPRKLAANYIPPVHRPVAPKLTPAEMLKRFHVLCDVPEEEVEVQPMMTDGFLPVPAIAPPPTEIATGIVPPLPGSPVILTSQPVQPVSPILPPPPTGAPAIPAIPITPGGPIAPGLPVQPSQPITPGTPLPPPVPEPSSLVLMLTGAAGLGARLLRRKS